MANILFHPVTTFIAGALLTLLALGVFFAVSSPGNRSADWVDSYNATLRKKLAGEPINVSESLKRFTGFLQGIGDPDFVKSQTSKVYSDDAYLNDTLVTHHGAKEIEAYFLETSKTMTSFEVKIDDTFRSGDDHYVRWTMIFSAPALAKGKPVHSIGVSQIRFNQAGEVTFHQDFWDSGANFFAHIPVSGAIIETIRKRLK